MIDYFDYELDDGRKVSVEYEIHPGEPQQWYDQNGDPGTPRTPDAVELLSIKDEDGKELITELSESGEADTIEARAYELID